MNWAYERGIHKNDSYRKFKAPEREKEVICLTSEELFRLYNYKFKKDSWKKARDIYCFGCFTGFRYSDIKELKPEHIKEGWIEKVIKKTKEFARIPLNKYALEILNKYSDTAYEPLPVISEQKLNDHLKKMCEEAEINSLISVTRFSGGKAEHSTLFKYQLITTHTARKTFTTNSLVFGMSETEVKKITGHKQDRHFRKYVNVAEKHLEQSINKAWDDYI